MAAMPLSDHSSLEEISEDEYAAAKKRQAPKPLLPVIPDLDMDEQRTAFANDPVRLSKPIVLSSSDIEDLNGL